MRSESDRVEVAARLRGQGWTLQRIARVMGVSAQTVARWLDPEQAERSRAGSLAWKHAHRQDLKAYDREYRIDNKVPCPWCAGQKDPEREMCRNCRQAIADFRYSVVTGCWEDDWLISEIADVFETTVNCAHVMIHRLRRRGEIGYRYRVGPDGYRLPNTYRLSEVA